MRRLLYAAGILPMLTLGALPGSPFGGTAPSSSLALSGTNAWTGINTFTGSLATGVSSGVAIGIIPSTTRGAVCLNQASPSSANCTLYDLSATTVLNSTAGVALTINGTTRFQVDATGRSVVGASGAGVSNWIEGTGTLDFASASTGACSADLTITATGAVAGDECNVGVLNASVPAGSIFSCWVSATNTVSVRHCCLSGTTCDPASGVFRARVTNH
jgi:hypothetical protein